MKTHEEQMKSLSPERRAKVKAMSEEIKQVYLAERSSLAKSAEEAIKELEWLFAPDRFPSYKDEWETIKEAVIRYVDLCR